MVKINNKRQKKKPPKNKNKTKKKKRSITNVGLALYCVLKNIKNNKTKKFKVNFGYKNLDILKFNMPTIVFEN